MTTDGVVQATAARRVCADEGDARYPALSAESTDIHDERGIE